MIARAHPADPRPHDAAVVDLADRLTVEVDPSADAADWDQALAVFLLKFVRKQATRSAGTAAVEVARLERQ